MDERDLQSTVPADGGEERGAGVGRRDVLKLALAAGAFASLGHAARAALPAPSPGLFFTPAELRLVDQLTEIIIPADDHSPGARAAGAAAYIDKTLAEAFESAPKKEWKEGLARIDALAAEMHHKRFSEATPDEQVAVVKRIAAHERNPKLPEERFFRLLKNATAHAYYTSKIGIHTEMEYKGNVAQDEFAGYEVK